MINNIALLNLRPKHPERTDDGVERQVYNILKDGADSVGAACLDNPTEEAGKNDTACAALRVYVNIGMCADYWTTLHDPVFGTIKQMPFDPRKARRISPDCDVAWTATQAQMGGARELFAHAAAAKVKDAPYGPLFISGDNSQLCTAGSPSPINAPNAIPVSHRIRMGDSKEPMHNSKTMTSCPTTAAILYRNAILGPMLGELLDPMQLPDTSGVTFPLQRISPSIRW